MYEGPRALRFREIDAPEVTAEVSAVVRPLTVATCDLDALFAG